MNSFLEWAKAELNGRGAGPSLICDCPFCGKAEHLYIHQKEGYWTCFKCDKRNRDIIWLVAEVTGESYKAIKLKRFREVVKFRWQNNHQDEDWDRYKNILRAKEKEMIEILPPDEFISVFDGKKWQMPKYLVDRGIEREIALRYYLGFCNKGDYRNRIIFPFSCPNGFAFTSRAVDDREPKYFHPKGTKFARMLYGWSQIYSEITNGEVALVEGPMDVLKLATFGINALGLFGKELHDPQKALLLKLNLKTIVVMMDNDSEVDLQIPYSAIAICNKLVAICDDLRVARLPANTDPGDLNVFQAHSYYRNAVVFEAGRNVRI